MSSVTKFKALELAAQVAAAAATANGLRLVGVPVGDAAAAAANGEVDSAYIAALVNTIADKIKTT